MLPKKSIIKLQVVKPTSDPFGMSAEEYLAGAGSTGPVQPPLTTLPAAPDPLSWAAAKLLLSQASTAAAIAPDASAPVFVDAGNGVLGTLPYKVGDPAATIVIVGVHRLPQRPTSQRSASPMMQAYQNSGSYPTLEDHLAHKSPGYVVVVDSFGRYTYQEESGKDAR